MKDTEQIEEELEDYLFKGKTPAAAVSIERARKIKEEEKDEEINIFREIGSTILWIVAALLFTFLFLNFVGERTLVSGSSMENTLSDGDQLYLDKLVYRFREPERFDIVVFPYEADTTRLIIPFRKTKEVDYIKRIIGLPGETVFISESGDIYINDEILVENYGNEKIKDPGIALYEVELGNDEYFVMGDNRNNSKDSRFASVGNIKRSDILGKIRGRIYPFNKMGKVDK